MADCLIGLGSNLGDRAAQLEQACRALGGHPQIQSRALSTFHATAPIGGPARQDAFLNAALRITTALSPRQLLAAVHDVEQQLGRQRLVRWGPRTIDIDILLYDQQVVESEELVLPHPRMAVRRFVLEPACEVAADMIHPPTGWPVSRLLERLGELPQYVAIAGIDARQTAELAVRSAQITGARLWLDPASRADGGVTDDAGTISADRELQLVRARLDQLNDMAAGPCAQAGRWHVCSYWLPQSLAVVRVELAGLQRQQVEQACARAILRAPLPQCIVFLDTRPIGTHTAGRGSTPALAQELTCQLAQTGQGPVLRIPGGDPQLAVTELSAAIDAMR